MSNEIRLNRFEVKDYQYEEAIKTLRTNIQFSGRNLKVIMMTSSVPNEGKSETSFSLASSLAQLDKKVLLIDADIRKSVFASRYHLGKTVDGLSQYLSGQKKMDEVVYQTNVPNLSMIFAGPFCPNPAELLEENLMGNLISRGREYYDYVIIDTPPMSNLIDGAVISQHCDGAVIVIESGAISYRILQKVKTQLSKSGCRILGVVLNKVNIHESGYYHYYGKYGEYYSYGKEYGKEES